MGLRGPKSHTEKMAAFPTTLAVVKARTTRLRPPAPAHLDAQEKKIWSNVCEDYKIETNAALDILLSACENHQRARLAREQIAIDGMTVTDKFGQSKPHPLLATERDARAAWIAAIKFLGIKL